MIPLIIDNKTTNYMISDTGEVFNNKTNKYLNTSVNSGYSRYYLYINSQRFVF